MHLWATCIFATGSLIVPLARDTIMFSHDRFVAELLRNFSNAIPANPGPKVRLVKETSDRGTTSWPKSRRSVERDIRPRYWRRPRQPLPAASKPCRSKLRPCGN